MSINHLPHPPPPATMKFVKNSKELDTAVNEILGIFYRLVVSLGRLESAEKLQSWREAVKEMRRVLESVRNTANRTDNVPLLLIGVDRFIHWTENLGAPGVPFPDWHHCLYPSRDAITDHPWLLNVEQRYDATCLGLVVRQESSTSEPVLVQIPTAMLEPTTQPTSNLGPIQAVSVNKGKGKEIAQESEGIEKEHTSQREGNDDGESEVVEKDVEMEEEMSEPIHGRPKKRARSRSQLQPASTRQKSQSQPKRLGRKDGESQVEGISLPSNHPTTPKPKYGRAQVAACTTPPHNPEACGTCINRKMVCMWTPGTIPCNLCKKRKIGCMKANVHHASTAHTPKPPARRQASPSQCKSSHPQKQPPPLTDDDDTPAPPPRKKARVAQGGQTPQSGAAASTSSAPQRRITLVVRPPQDTSTHPVPPAIQPESSTYTPLPVPPIPPSIAYSPPPTAPSPPRMLPVDMTNLSIHRRLDDIIHRQDLIHGRVNETDMCLARWERRSMGISDAPLTHKMETLRASVHGAQPVQTTRPPTTDEDLLGLLGLPQSNTATDQADKSITADLQGLVLTSTQSGHDIEITQQVHEGITDAEIEMEGGALQVGNESGACPPEMTRKEGA
ncbi:hypothetical protein BKA83DRAFT_4502420 [Pisolithus microcarpus]|nr:hypothetical protein BKA83DRAFT_4502420 [Pisolithus microcarpus]